MKKEDVETISTFMGVSPIKINSRLIAPALRDRWYWTNIPNVRQPEQKDIKLQDILVDGYTDREKARCLAVIDSRPNATPIKMFHRYYSTGFTTLIFKSKEHYENCVKEYESLSGGKRKISANELDNYRGSVFDGVRYMYQEELEKCQTVPSGYTSCLSRNEAADVLGDGWTVDVIAHIFTHIPKEI
jgi:DNA (cytosine-5)-methyltransferase 3A